MESVLGPDAQLSLQFWEPVYDPLLPACALDLSAMLPANTEPRWMSTLLSRQGMNLAGKGEELLSRKSGGTDKTPRGLGRWFRLNPRDRQSPASALLKTVHI